jgi:hypothetical protein
VTANQMQVDLIGGNEWKDAFDEVQNLIVPKAAGKLNIFKFGILACCKSNFGFKIFTEK